MPAYAAMLRGINVGGSRKLPMADLRALFADLGHTDVATYVQSGNVVFHTRRSSTARIAAELEGRLAEAVGSPVPVVLRTAEQMAATVAANPYLPEGADPRVLHVTFLRDAPEAERLRSLALPSSRQDTARVVGQDVYLCCPDGYGTTKLTPGFWERALGVATTTRNWRTVTTLAEMSVR